MKRSIFIMAAAVICASATMLVAGETNWISQLGRLAQDTTDVRSTMEQVDAPYKQEFAARLLRAANTLPLDPEAKNERIARIAHELVAGAKTFDEKVATLCTVFTKTEPMYLSGVADTFSVGLNVASNGLSQVDFIDIATNVIACVERKTVGDPDALLRVTMTIATFLRAAGPTVDLEPTLLAALSDSGMAELVQPVLGAAAKREYGPMLRSNSAERSGGANVFVAAKAASMAMPGAPLFLVTDIPSVGVGGLGSSSGLSGRSFKGVDARPMEPERPPRPPTPYNGQTINP